MDAETKRENMTMQVYKFIVNYTKENLCPPGIRDICEGCGFKSTSSAANQVDNLVKRGYLSYIYTNSTDKNGHTERKAKGIKLNGFKLVYDGDKSIERFIR